MIEIPEDILHIIFAKYLCHSDSTVLSLTPVCRTWYNILISTPSFWSKVIVNIRSIQTIPFLLSSTAFHLYLSRSSPKGRQERDDKEESEGAEDQLRYPLDIDIRWHTTSNLGRDHSITCDTSPLEVLECPNSPCRLQPTRQEQLRDLLTFLADGLAQPAQATSSSHSSNAELSGVATSFDLSTRGSNKIVGRRIDRWRSLSLDLSGMIDFLSPSVFTLEPLDSPSYTPLNLSHLALRSIASHSGGFHDAFASNISSLRLTDCRMAFLIKLETFTHLKSLTIVIQKFLQPSLHRTILLRNLEELAVSIPINWYAHFDLPKLKILRIIEYVPILLYDKLDSKYRDQGKDGHSKRSRLDEIHLYALPAEALSRLSRSRLVTTSYFIYIHTHSILDPWMDGTTVSGYGGGSELREQNDQREVTEDPYPVALAWLLSRCDEDCTIMAADGRARTLLDAAKSNLHYVDPLATPIDLFTSDM